MRSALRRPQALILLLLLLNVCLSGAQILPGIFIFGDSTVDSGNNNYLPTIFKANFPPYGRDFDNKTITGRFCNGRVSTDYLSLSLGLPFAPAYLSPKAEGSKIVQGVNFATAGSGLLEATAVAINVPGLMGQMEWFKEYRQKLIKIVGEDNATSLISQGLFVLSTGSNDYLNSYYINPLLQVEYDRDTYRGLLIESFENFVKWVYEIGGRRASVVSFIPLGCVPSQITLYGKGQIKCIDFPNEDAKLFNTALNASVLSLRKRFSGLKLAYVDLYTLFDDVFKNPSQYGFQQTLTGCCGIGRLASSILCNEFTIGTCPDASKYVFWDSFHSSDRMNKLIANTSLVQGLPILS